MSILDHAKKELSLIGMGPDATDEMSIAMRDHLLHMVNEFAEEGHSGFSASYAIKCLEKLLKFEPITPLTGDDSEWNEVSRDDGPLYQNNRCGRVFKDNDGAYDIEGKVFWEWATSEVDGEKFKSYFTSRESRVPVTFPYTPVHEYIEYVRD